MNRRLVLAAVLATALGGGLAAPALASSPDTTRHKICIDHKKLLPEGFCIVWDDPTGQDSAS